jgi:hypothetical protein
MQKVLPAIGDPRVDGLDTGLPASTLGCRESRLKVAVETLSLHVLRVSSEKPANVLRPRSIPRFFFDSLRCADPVLTVTFRYQRPRLSSLTVPAPSS